MLWLLHYDAPHVLEQYQRQPALAVLPEILTQITFSADQIFGYTVDPVWLSSRFLNVINITSLSLLYGPGSVSVYPVKWIYFGSKARLNAHIELEKLHFRRSGDDFPPGWAVSTWMSG